ncbi:MAG: choice-of-anchor V domain-containing protein [Balneolaceae bacterium]|nr:choice-of-anchor V domain-containing protein [Balneolaceae bacterium]
MRGSLRNIGLCLLAPFAVLWAVPEAPPKHADLLAEPVHAPFPEQLTGAFTGDFGEDTCRSCHFDYPLNPEGGSLELKGIPERFAPGQTYTLHIILRRENLRLGGFQLTARHSDSSQAGRFSVDSPSLQFTRGLGGVNYVQHTPSSTEPAEEGLIRWEVPWTAPASGEVRFSLAANAGNGDASAFGDYIFSLSRSVAPDE